MTTHGTPKKDAKKEGLGAYLSPEGSERRSFIQKRACDLYKKRLEKDAETDWIACVSDATGEWDAARPKV